MRRGRPARSCSSTRRAARSRPFRTCRPGRRPALFGASRSGLRVGTGDRCRAPRRGRRRRSRAGARSAGRAARLAPVSLAVLRRRLRPRARGRWSGCVRKALPGARLAAVFHGRASVRASDMCARPTSLRTERRSRRGVPCVMVGHGVYPTPRCAPRDARARDLPAAARARVRRRRDHRLPRRRPRPCDGVGGRGCPRRRRLAAVHERQRRRARDPRARSAGAPRRARRARPPRPALSRPPTVSLRSSRRTPRRRGSPAR